jgi:hypothetical protein
LGRETGTRKDINRVEIRIAEKKVGRKKTEVTEN